MALQLAGNCVSGAAPASAELRNTLYQVSNAGTKDFMALLLGKRSDVEEHNSNQVGNALTSIAANGRAAKLR
jgi:hypothetical protein